MQKFETLEELIQAKANAQHEGNLTSGGVYDAKGNLWSDINIEYRVAVKRVCWEAERVAFVAEIHEEPGLSPKGYFYIRKFGYCKATQWGVPKDLGERKSA